MPQGGPKRKLSGGREGGDRGARYMKPPPRGERREPNTSKPDSAHLIITTIQRSIAYVRNAIWNITVNSLNYHNIQGNDQLLTISAAFVAIVFVLHSIAKRHINRQQVTRYVVFVLLITVIPTTSAGRDEDGSSTGQICPIFEGVSASFTA